MMSPGNILSKLNKDKVNPTQATAAVVKSAAIGVANAGVQHYTGVPNVTDYAQYAIDGAVGAVSSTAVNKASTELEKRTKKTVGGVDREQLMPKPREAGEKQDVKTGWRLAGAASSMAVGVAVGGAVEYGLNMVNPHYPFWNKATATTAAALAKDLSGKLIDTGIQNYAPSCMRMTPTPSDP